MKINVNSWHYKLNDFMGFDKRNTNFCKYFWTTLFHLLIALSVVSVFSFVLFIFGYGFYDLYQNTFQSYFHYNDLGEFHRLMLGFFVTIIIVFTGFGLVFLVGVTASKIQDNMREKQVQRYREYLNGQRESWNKDSNILVEFLKAKKQKICPRIEYNGK